MLAIGGGNNASFCRERKCELSQQIGLMFTLDGTMIEKAMQNGASMIDTNQGGPKLLFYRIRKNFQPFTHDSVLLDMS